MAVDFSGDTASELYAEGLIFMGHNAEEQDSRNGPVYTVTRPVTFCLRYPWNRQGYCRDRRANHVFHVMEALWMLAGYQYVEFLENFNSNIATYANDGVIEGAYGYRWRNHFDYDQLFMAIQRLKTDPSDRQVVIQMWDANKDLPRTDAKDRPCNTHIYLRINDACLDMHVINRSNDYLWGALGSNIVHFTMLQEFLAAAIGAELGKYYVTTNNLHIYKSYPNLDSIWAAGRTHVPPQTGHLEDIPLVGYDENWRDVLNEIQRFICNDQNGGYSRFIDEVAVPMRNWYLDREHRDHHIDMIQDGRWKLAIQYWNRDL